MVGSGLFDRFRLGAFGEVRVAEALSEAVALLLGSGGGLKKPQTLRFEIDQTLQGQRVSMSLNNHTQSWITDSVIAFAPIALGTSLQVILDASASEGDDLEPR